MDTFELAQKEYEYFRQTRPSERSSFKEYLFQAIQKADLENLRKLWYGFPNEVNAVLVFGGLTPITGDINKSPIAMTMMAMGGTLNAIKTKS